MPDSKVAFVIPGILYISLFYILYPFYMLPYKVTEDKI